MPSTLISKDSVKHVYMTERVGIGQFLLASATSGFSSYIKLAYCSSAQELQ